jgi:hypothetical protein
MTTKPAPPPAAAEWLRYMDLPPPRCCHTCYQYTIAGNCIKFNQRPPDEFTQTLNACDQWEDSIPF